uniref:Uncharacterized protein n=1 Tax=Lotus japonicus TaxID=34305 RepID=I3SHI8_LOTJA|nr:unknown [Lotus japonicus]
MISILRLTVKISNFNYRETNITGIKQNTSPRLLTQYPTGLEHSNLEEVIASTYQLSQGQTHRVCRDTLSI